ELLNGLLRLFEATAEERHPRGERTRPRVQGGIRKSAERGGACELLIAQVDGDLANPICDRWGGRNFESVVEGRKCLLRVPGARRSPCVHDVWEREKLRRELRAIRVGEPRGVRRRVLGGRIGGPGQPGERPANGCLAEALLDVLDECLALFD